MARRFSALGFAALLAACLLVPVAPSFGEDRRVAVIVDTSGSMEQSDRQRYTLLVTQIVGDLLDPTDEIAVIRMGPDGCGHGVSPDLMVTLDPSRRDQFKSRLDRLIAYSGGTNFAAPVRTATEFLQRDPAVPRLLLVVADSGGLGGCSRVLTPELVTLKQSGATLAAINLGSNQGAFDRHRAFSIARNALDAEALIRTVAQVYQQFLGIKSIQTGRVSGDIEVEIAPYVANAFLVVTADGPIPELLVEDTSPKSDDIDLNFRGGGASVGLDRVERSYRMIKLTNPEAGSWTFRVPGLAHDGGWMLLQDSAVLARLVSASTVPAGLASTVEVELYDRRTGRRIKDLEDQQNLTMTLDVGDQTAALTDDGQGADREEDGLFTGSVRLTEAGEYPGTVRIESPLLDRRVDLTLSVKEAAWNLQPDNPREHRVDQPLDLKVHIQPVGDPALLEPPGRIEAAMGTVSVELRDDGTSPDEQDKDGTYSGTYQPTQLGELKLDFHPVGGSPSLPAAGRIDIIGFLELEEVPALDFGATSADQERLGQLDLSSSRIRGDWPIELTTDLDLERVSLEIEALDGWHYLDSDSLTLRLSDAGPSQFAVRLRVGRCPEGSQDKIYSLTIHDPADPTQTQVVPIQLSVAPEAWWYCWWPVLLTIALCLLAAFVINGIVSPSRFPRRLGIVLSPEEDIEAEGFFHPVRSVRGSGSGFYRDARIHVTLDYRLSSKAQGALAQLRADRSSVKLRPVGGTVWRLNIDGEWEVLPENETTARNGVVFRNDDKTLYFTLRNG